MIELSNWAGNHRYQATRLHSPESVAQIQEIVTRSRKLRALGTRHSFNAIADTPEDLVSVERLDKILSLDRARRTVTVEAGIRYGTLCRYLHEEGFAVHNLASLPHISVAGACATATHGSGDKNGNLATSVSGLELVTGAGEILTLTRERNGERFAGAVVNLGGLGIVTKLTLNVEPAFTMRQDVYENLTLAQLEAHFDEIEGSAYSVSLFTDWREPKFTQVWRKSRVEAGTNFIAEPKWFGATLAPRPFHPIADVSPVNCTEQMGVPGPWFERLPHFRMDFMPSCGEELQAEYIVPRPNALAALNAVAEIREQIAPLLLISEIRTVAADDLWMSPCYGQPGVCIHFTLQPDWPAVKNLLPKIEECLAPFAARPHWGKLFTTPPERVRSLYPKRPDFQRLLQTCDPEGKFRNAFLDAYVFGAE